MNTEITGMWFDEYDRRFRVWPKRVVGAERAARKKEAAERTAWNTYSIHDRDAVKERLAVQHKAKQDVAAKLGHPIPTDHDFAMAVFQNQVRRLRFIGATGKYLPHQGKQECARRVRQGGNYGL